MTLQYTIVPADSGQAQATIQAALDTAAASGYEVVGMNDSWMVLARKFEDASPAV